MLRKLFMTATALILTLTLALPAAAMRIVVNDRELNVSAVSDNGSTLVPLRDIFQALGANVGWEEETQSISAVKAKTTIKLQIGSNAAYKNGDQVSLAVAPQLINEKTMVPLRFVSEALGATVKWNEETQTASISVEDEGKKYDTKEKTEVTKDEDGITTIQSNIEGVGLVNTYRPFDNIFVGTNFNMELLFISAATGSGFTHKGYVADNRPLNNKIKAYYSKYKDNKNAVEMNELADTSSVVASKKFGNSTVASVLAYGQVLKDNLLYKFLDDGLVMFKKKNMTFRDMKNVLRNFADETNSMAFFKDNLDLYNNMTKEFVSKYNFNHVKRIEEFYGVDMSDHIFSVVLSTAMAGGQAFELESKDGKAVHFNVTNPSFPEAQTLNVLYHETAHNFYATSIYEKNKELIDRYSSCTGVLNSDYKFDSALNETLARVVTVAVIEKYHGKDMAMENLNKELKAGWSGLDDIYYLVKNKYIGDREKYSTFEGFFPVVLEYIKAKSQKQSFDVGAKEEIKSLNYTVLGRKNDVDTFGEKYGIRYKGLGPESANQEILDGSDVIILLDYPGASKISGPVSSLFTDMAKGDKNYINIKKKSGKTLVYFRAESKEKLYEIIGKSKDILTERYEVVN